MVTKKTTSKLSPVANRRRKKVKVKIPKTENIIFIGSEMSYNSFWLKMMFVGAAYVGAKNLRNADKKTIAYVDEGYTHAEKLAIENLKYLGFEFVKLTSSSDVTNLLNKDRENYKLLDVMFFSHGLVNEISLNYKGRKTVTLSSYNITSINSTAFAKHGKIYSYACRTGISINNDFSLSDFESDSDAKPEDSIAQKLANHLKISVSAFLRRTFYGNVLRDRSKSSDISSALKELRKTEDGQIIDLPPNHQALPHPGLGSSSSWSPLKSGPEKEGTNEYALWRKQGGIELPTAAETPKGLSAGMRTFNPL